jgi:hypothetical protein
VIIKFVDAEGAFQWLAEDAAYINRRFAVGDMIRNDGVWFQVDRAEVCGDTEYVTVSNCRNNREKRFAA